MTVDGQAQPKRYYKYELHIGVTFVLSNGSLVKQEVVQVVTEYGRSKLDLIFVRDNFAVLQFPRRVKASTLTKHHL